MAASMLSGCGSGEGGTPFHVGMSDAEEAIRGGLKDDQGVLPVEILAERGVSDRIQAAARSEPDMVFKIYNELKADGVCDQPDRSLGEKINLEGGGQMPVLRDPGRVCDFLLAESAKNGNPDANFDRGVQDIVNSDEMYRKNANYYRPEIELLLERAEKHFTIAQQSKTPGVPDAARQALATFQAQQYSRGYGGAAADQMRAMFLGFMAISFIQESSKFAAAAEEHCRAVQAGAAAALQPIPDC